VQRNPGSIAHVVQGCPGLRFASSGLQIHAFFRFAFGSFAALRSAALMRLCQPRPPRRKQVTASG
jgi:hypothetical protein